MSFIKRKHIRLRHFDYSSANASFITICVKDFALLFGEIRNGIMGLSERGNAAAVLLQAIPELRSNILLDEFIIMPNHLHCILEIVKDTHTETKTGEFGNSVAGSISVIINQYKGAVKKWCTANDYQDFEWQVDFMIMLSEMISHIKR